MKYPVKLTRRIRLLPTWFRHFFRKYWVALAIGGGVGALVGIGVLLVNVADLARDNIVIQDEIIDLQEEIIGLQKNQNETTGDIEHKLDCMTVFFAADRADRKQEAVIEDIENCVIELREAEDSQEATHTHTETIIIEREAESEPEDTHPGQGRGRNR